MTKRFLLLILAGLWAVSYARAEETAPQEVDPNGPWMICNVAVDGLKNIRSKTVTKAAHAKKGELYERYTISDDIRDISALGNFDQVEIDISPMPGTRADKETGEEYPCHRLTYLVTEKPIFDRLTYEGRKHLGKGAITQAMTLKLKDPFNEAKLQADLDRIKAKYAEKGYINADVKYELEQDERPIDYDAELEDAEEEAAPTSEKRLKRELRAEALRRLEDAARTAEDFAVVVEEWNKLDRNRERRERDHENLRGDVPLEYQAVPEPRIVPRWLNNPAVRQLCSGNFLDILFDCPYEMHQLTANAFLSQMIEELSEEHKEILYFLSLRLYSTTQLAQMRGQSDRNIRKVRNTIRKKLQKKLYAHLCRMQDEGKSLTLRERQFMEEYAALLGEKGKDAVIRRENKTKRRKKKAALDGGKGSE